MVVIAIKKNLLNHNTHLVLKHTAFLEIAWAGFQCMLGLFLFFDMLEAAPEGESLIEMVSRKGFTLFLLLGFALVHVSIGVAMAVRLIRKHSV